MRTDLPHVERSPNVRHSAASNAHGFADDRAVGHQSGIIRLVLTTPDQLVGKLIDVAASWYRTPEGDRVPLPMHVWLTIDGLGVRKLHTPGTGSIAILDEPAHLSYDMDRYGTVEVVGGTPDVLAAKVGQTIEATSALWQEPPGEEVGFILHFRDGNIGVANLADDLVIEPWPSAAWTRWGVSGIAE
jgi:hypothetical protein